MRREFPASETAVYALLVLGTALSWWVGAAHGLPPGVLARAAAPVVLLIAFAKMWLVGDAFMELRGAPRPLRLAFLGWTVLFGSATAVLSLP